MATMYFHLLLLLVVASVNSNAQELISVCTILGGWCGLPSNDECIDGKWEYRIPCNPSYRTCCLPDELPTEEPSTTDIPVTTTWPDTSSTARTSQSNTPVTKPSAPSSTAKPSTTAPVTNPTAPISSSRPSTATVPVTSAPVTKPSAPSSTAKPSTIKPSTIKPSTIKPSTIKPSTIKPSTIKPSTIKPSTIKPSTIKPSTIKPSTIKPSTIKPSTIKPSTIKPSTIKPSTIRPSTIKPSTIKPSTTKPSTIKPSTTKPSTTKPSTIKPSTIKPSTTKPSTIKPSTTTKVPGPSSTTKPSSTIGPITTPTATTSTPGNGTVADCGAGPHLYSMDPDLHIVGGAEAVQNSWPWMVSLEFDFFGRNDWKHHCGATLLNNQWVLTAAQCIAQSGAPFPKNYRVVVGKHARDQTKVTGHEQIIPVSMFVVHEAYSTKIPGSPNDIALVKLANPVGITPQVAPVCLPPTPKEDFTSKDKCYILGFGDTKGLGKENVLNEARVPITANKVCNEKWVKIMGTDNPIQPKHICSGNWVPRNCNGDKGGPLVCQRGSLWVQAGIMSFGDVGCTADNAPDVYTRVSLFNDWINEKTQN